MVMFKYEQLNYTFLLKKNNFQYRMECHALINRIINKYKKTIHLILIIFLAKN